MDAPSASLQELKVDEKIKRSGIRVLLQLQQENSITTVTPSTSLRYLDVGDDRDVILEDANQHIIRSQSAKNLASITQSSSDIKFTLDVQLKNGKFQGIFLPFDLYYDVASDNIVIYNRSDVVVHMSFVPDSQTADFDQPLGTVFPRQIKALGIGTYAINALESRIVEFKILAKESKFDTSPEQAQPNTTEVNPLKRALSGSQERPEEPRSPHPRQSPKIRPNPEATNNSIVFHPTSGGVSGGFLFTGSTIQTGNPLNDLCQHGVLHVPGVLGIRGYQLHKRKIISSTNLSEVSLAQHSGINHAEVVVKILKVRRSYSSSNHVMSLLKSAEDWRQEFDIHNSLNHESIVALYGGDSRFFALYLEFIPGFDLGKKGVWRDPDNNHFGGSDDDAFQIWLEISRALEYLHSQEIEHNDIKPANILFSNQRGAVLCDFGLSLKSNASRPSYGGTPWYIPPEFIASNKRGKAGDIYALGVTMLYLKRLISLPESDRSGDFTIVNIQSPERVLRQPAREKMISWLAKVTRAQTLLSVSNAESFVIRDMLNGRPRNRATATEVVKRLELDLFSRTHRPQPKEIVNELFGVEHGTKNKTSTSQRSTDHGSTTQENESFEWTPIGPKESE